MAQIRPFAAYRYDLGAVDAADVVTQPYDKISAEMQKRYFERSPYNFVRIILGEKLSSDNAQNNVYTRAARYLEDWIASGILRKDPEPAVYPYTQTFTLTGESHALTRRGFIALGRLEDYKRQVVFRHERTLAGPKQDRLELLRATQAHFGQIFMLYSDPAQTTEAALFARATTPILEARDEYGTIHRLFREADAGVLAKLQAAMAKRPLVIADGHHRYETALAWRDEQRARLPQVADSRDGAPWDWAMMTFVNLDAPGLVVLPTHRVVHGMPAWDAAAAAERLRRYFAVEAVAGAWNQAWPQLREALARAAGEARPALAAALGGGNSHPPALFFLRLREDLDLDAELPAYHEQQRSLPVLLLHELILDRSFGIDAEAVRRESHLRYERDARAAHQAVASGQAQAAFFLHSVTPQKVRDVALAGAVMPQKSTDFFPKLLSGLTFYRVESNG
ncbi:MAG: DUF1015 domain-containing protein [Terriglobales bacterium]